MNNVLFEEPFIVCYLDESVPVMAHKWKSHPNKDEFKATLLRMIEKFKELKKIHPKLTWCGDTTHLSVLSLETQTWLNEKWTGIMVEAGVEFHALIVPKDVFGKHAMKKFKESMDNQHKTEIHIQHFMDEEAAFKWLQQSAA